MPDQSTPKRRHLTVFLLKPGVSRFVDALKTPQDLDAVVLRTDLPFDAGLYVKPPSDKLPAWCEFLSEGTRDPLESYSNKSVSAVLFVWARERLLAFTFGHGRYLLKPDVYEPDFGLKVTLNTVDPEKLWSVDMRTLEQSPIFTRRQTSRSSSIGIFGIDITRDLVRAVAGEPRDLSLANMVAGSSSLAISANLRMNDLGAKSAKLVTAYSRTRYKSDFPWVDNVKRLVDGDLTSKLDERLVASLSGDYDGNLYLAPPEVVDYADLKHFEFKRLGSRIDPVNTLEIEKYRELLAHPEDLSIEDLWNHRVEMVSASDESNTKSWPVYKCLGVEIDYRRKRYVLDNGSWFLVDASLVKQVEENYKRVSKNTVNLPDAELHEHEGDYNERAAATSSDFAMMDRALARCSGAETRIEVCDIFTSKRQFIHVKRFKGSSALSHLFSQGLVSAETFISDVGFREDVKALVKEARTSLAGKIPIKQPDPSDFEVVFAIVAEVPRSGWPRKLPFFSLLNLMSVGRRIEMLGYQMSAILIKEKA